MNLSNLLSVVLDCDIIESSISDDIIYMNEAVQYWDDVSKYFRYVPIEREIYTEIFMKRCKKWFFDNKEISIFNGIKRINDVIVYEANILNSNLSNINLESEEMAVFELCIKILGEDNE